MSIKPERFQWTWTHEDNIPLDILNVLGTEVLKLKTEITFSGQILQDKFNQEMSASGQILHDKFNQDFTEISKNSQVKYQITS